LIRCHAVKVRMWSPVSRLRKSQFIGLEISINSLVNFKQYGYAAVLRGGHVVVDIGVGDVGTGKTAYRKARTAVSKNVIA
jgi:hypothetical protein